MKCRVCGGSGIVYQNVLVGNLCRDCYIKYQSILNSQEFNRSYNGWYQVLAMENLSNAFSNVLKDLRTETNIGTVPTIDMSIIQKSKNNYALMVFKTNLLDIRGHLEEYDGGKEIFVVTIHGDFNCSKSKYIKVERVDGSGFTETKYYYESGKIIHRILKDQIRKFRKE